MAGHVNGKRVLLTGGSGFLGLEDGLRRTIDWYRDQGPGSASAAGRATVA